MRSTGVSAETPFVVFGDDWRRFVSTLQHLFAHVINRRCVIWVNSFGHRAPKLTLYDMRRAAVKLAAMARRPASGPPADPTDPARIIHPRVLPWHNVAPVHAFNTRSLLHDIRRALRDVAPDAAPVVVTGGPAPEGVLGRLGELASIYFCMDDYAEMPGVDRSIVAPLEVRLLKKVDATVATAGALTTLKKPASGRAYHLPQGVNYDHFAMPRPEPDDLSRVPRPRIGFAGTLSTACDFDLWRALAEAFPEASLVHVGPTQLGVQPLPYPNFHTLGMKPYQDLPAYSQHFDVAIVPYVLNEWTRSVDPLKLLEYMATGVPIVATGIPEVYKYQEALAIGEDIPLFVEEVRQVLRAGPDLEKREARQALARRHTWKHRADRFLEIVDEVAAARAGLARAQGTS